MAVTMTINGFWNIMPCRSMYQHRSKMKDVTCTFSEPSAQVYPRRLKSYIGL